MSQRHTRFGMAVSLVFGLTLAPLFVPVHASTQRDTGTIVAPVRAIPLARADHEQQLNPAASAAILAASGCQRGGIVLAHTTAAGTIYVIKPPASVDPAMLSDHDLNCYGFGQPPRPAQG